MAFMAGPRLVLLDEPAGGVNLTMLGDLSERLQAINRETRATFVVIEHNMEFVMALCTRIIVLAEGRSSPRARPPRCAAIRPSSKPIWGTDMSDPGRASSPSTDVVAGYGKMTILNGVTATIRRGAITTVIGPNGAGKSTLFKAVFGLLPRAHRPHDASTAPTPPTCRRAACSTPACATCRRAATSSPSSRCSTISSSAASRCPTARGWPRASRP